MNAIRVMIVDDTAVVRSVLAQVLEEEPDISVVGTAASGQEALERLPRLAPDILLLDVEMPGMGGLELLQRLRAAGALPPVLLFSSLTERGALVTIEALLLGARDYLTKPSMLGSPGAARDYIRRQVACRLRSILGRTREAVAPAAALPHVAMRPQASSARDGRAPVDAVVIAVSTGGPNALGTLLPALPANLPVPVFIVQHMPAFFTQALAGRLDQVCALRVAECSAPAAVAPGEVWLAQGGRHLVVARHGDTLWASPDDSAPENFCRPSADVLFRAAVAAFGGRLLGVVLTGMGHDGLAGCRAICAAGGQVIAQDRVSSVVWGMPACVVEAGLASLVLPLQDIAAEIVRRAAATRPWFTPQSGMAPGVPA